MAKNSGMATIGMTGEGGGMASLCDALIDVPSREAPGVQEIHLFSIFFCVNKFR